MIEDLLPPAAEAVLTVSDLNRLARQTLERNFPLLWVAGEISNLTQAVSGHVYFSLKDEAAQVRCVMFRNRAQVLPWRLANGMQVEARVLVTLYEARGDYQLNVETLRRAGVGALHEAFARLRDRLATEGLFDARLKRPLPRYPARIGIVTSLQAAALRDVVAALKRRAPHVPVVLYPVPVQGDGAAEKIAAMLCRAGERMECDVLILARGGGSIEDLWPFNEEILARALRACALPVVCGVGHETDVTIADFAADQRAATPTAAAELVSASYVEAAQHLQRLAAHLMQIMRRMQDARMQRLDLLTHRLSHPGERLARNRMQVAHLHSRLTAAMRRTTIDATQDLRHTALRLARAQPDLAPHRHALAQLQQRFIGATQLANHKRHSALEAIAAHLSHLNPQTVLARGYSIVRDDQGRIVRASDDVRIGTDLHLQFGSGWAKSRVTDKG